MTRASAGVSPVCMLQERIASGITFPPLAKGGPGGVVTRASASVCSWKVPERAA